MNKTFDFIAKSLLSGILIAFGCISYVVIENHALGAFVFSLGLLTVILQKSLLYTGKVGYLKYQFRHIFTYILPMLLLNLLAIWVICRLFASCSGIVLDTSALMAGKQKEAWSEALVRSIGCGAMMYIAVEGFRRYRNVLCVIMPIMCFILCGFEHCIANYGYMAMCGKLWVHQLPVWIIGNAIGSLVIRHLGGFED